MEHMEQIIDRLLDKIEELEKTLQYEKDDNNRLQIRTCELEKDLQGISLALEEKGLQAIFSRIYEIEKIGEYNE